MNHNLTSYYNDRAKEYDRVYQIPEEQNDLITATNIFQKLFHGKTVLEIACGTGYWTEQIAKSAESILATDINESVIEIAKGRNSFSNVTFKVANMYHIDIQTKFDGLFGGFIWSHILLQDLDDLLHEVTAYLKPGGILAFIDSKQVKGGVHDKQSITKIDEHGNTFQTRTLENGTNHLVLKNFPPQEFIVQKLSRFADEVSYTDLEHYWIVTCRLKA